MDNIVIDNFDTIKKEMTFGVIDEFYFIQIVKRSKDNPGMKKYLNVVRSFYIFTEEDYEYYKPTIKKLCAENNARAYMDFNKLNINDVKEKAKEILDKYYSYGHQLNNKKWFKKLQHCFDDSSVILGTTNKNNYEIVDIDEKNCKDKIEKYLNNKVVFSVPTVAGDHIIIKPYENRKEFFEKFNDIHVSIMNYCYILLYANIVN